MAPKAKATTADDSKKRKVEEKHEVPNKVGKTDSVSVAAAGQAAPDANVEREKDDVKDTRAAVKASVTFEPHLTTLNVVPAMGGKVLMALTDDGMQFFIAGARANVGVSKGRHFYEVKVLEHLAPVDVPMNSRRGVVPKQLLRVGFSTLGSDLVLGEDSNCVGFDSDGSFIVDGKKTTGFQKFGKEDVLAVLLNLDAKSPNANTISLFRDGVRISEPQALPEHLIGKTLYPHVAFRNLSIQTNFGPHPIQELPFKCKLLQNAAQADVHVAAKAGGKCEVIFPVGIPDEGTFDWLDKFLEDKPQFFELSDRKIIDWAEKSGIIRPVSSVSMANSQSRNSNDQPAFCYGMPQLDDLSAKKILGNMASLVPRDYVVMEVKSNLVPAERAELLKKFPADKYNCVAHVVMGEPPQAFKDEAQAIILKEKQEKAVKDWKAKKAEKERKKAHEARMKQVQELRKVAEERRKQAAEDAKKRAAEAKKKIELEKKAREEAAAKKVAEEKAEKGEDVKDDSVKDEEKVEDVAMEKATEETKEETKVETKDEPMEEAKEETKEEPKEEAKEETKEEPKDEPKEDEPEEWEKEPPVVELSDEDKAVRFRTKAVKDLTPKAMSSSFAKFSIPEKSEGFQAIKFEWDNEKSSKEYLTKWLKDQKLNVRFEDLKPSKWFEEKQTAWLKVLKEWQAKQKTKAKAETPKKGAEEEDDAEMEADVDIYSVDDVCDTGKGEALFKDFAFEDWCLFQLRFETYLLIQSFLKDIEDPERTGIPEKHFEFYYAKYFYKKIVPKNFGVDTLAQVFAMLKDTIGVNKDEVPIVEVKLSEDVEELSIFCKLAEEHRRERQRRVDAGDETGKLKFISTCMMTRTAGASAPAAAQQVSGPKPGASVTTVTAPRPVGAQWGVGAVRPAWAQPATAPAWATRTW